MDHPPIIRNWRYWIDGNGAWIPRSECTGHDLLLFGTLAIGVSWMVLEYFRYAWTLQSFHPYLSHVSQRLHLRRLMQVFIFCGLIHLSQLLLWYWTWYYLFAIAYWCNAAYAHSMNQSFVIAKRKFLAEANASDRLGDLVSKLDAVVQEESVEPKTLRQLAQELRDIVG